MDSAGLESLICKLHGAVGKLFNTETTTFVVVELGTGGRVKIRIHSPELRVCMEDMTKLMKERFNNVWKSGDMSCSDELRMLGAEPAQGCATCRLDKKEMKQCRTCVYSPLAVPTGCNSNGVGTTPDKLLETTYVYVDGVFDQASTDALRDGGFSAAVERTSIWSTDAEAGIQPVAPQATCLPEWQLDKEGMNALLKRQSRIALETSDERVKHMTVAIRAKHSEWKEVEPRKAFFLPKSDHYIFVGQGPGSSWCRNLNGAHDDCSVYWRFGPRGGGKVEQGCFHPDAPPGSTCECAKYMSDQSGLTEEQVHSLWPNRTSSSKPPPSSKAGRSGLPGAAPPTKRHKPSADPVGGAGAAAGPSAMQCEEEGAAEDATALAAAGADAAAPDQSPSLYEQLVGAHPDAAAYLPESSMQLTRDGVTLTLGRKQVDVPHQSVNAVWSAIVQDLRDRYGERMDEICERLGVARDKLVTLTTLDIRNLRTFLELDTLQKMASCGYFPKVTTIKVGDGSRFDERAFDAFKERICESRAQNWPNLEGVIETSDDDSDE